MATQAKLAQKPLQSPPVVQPTASAPKPAAGVASKPATDRDQFRQKLKKHLAHLAVSAPAVAAAPKPDSPPILPANGKRSNHKKVAAAAQVPVAGLSTKLKRPAEEESRSAYKKQRIAYVFSKPPAKSKSNPDQASESRAERTLTKLNETAKHRVEKHKEWLDGSRFRFLNEQLYTTTGYNAFKTFSQDPSLFHVYHQGYQNQVKMWPKNPLDDCIKFVKTLPKSAIIADFGCGEARLAASVPHKVHSLDLVAGNERITACDMAHTGLDSESIDAAIFCLSLMGTNFADFLKEANRVLKSSGLLKIAEVVSRVTDEQRFIELLANSGFTLKSKDEKNSHFMSWTFNKTGTFKFSKAGDDPILKPCFYKKR